MCYILLSECVCFMAKVMDFFTPELEEELTLVGDGRFEPQPVRAPGCVCVREPPLSYFPPQ